MGKIIRLTESQLVNLVKKFINEQVTPSLDNLVGSTVNIYPVRNPETAPRKGQALIKTVMNDGGGKYTMDIDFTFAPTLMPGNFKNTNLKMKFDCSKEGFEINFSKGRTQFFNKKLEKFFKDNFCSVPQSLAPASDSIPPKNM